MAIKLVCVPRKTYSWDEFKAAHGGFAIALDGVVHAPTIRENWFDWNYGGPNANFDHHSGVDRLATRSTSEQIALEINMGLFRTFHRNGIPEAKIVVNDPDEDTCLAYWLLANHERIIGHAEPAINRLVYMEDRLDVTAGAYPFCDSHMRRIMAWIFEPYNNARFSDKLKDMDAGGMETIIEAVCSRITRYSLGDSHELALGGEYEKIGGGKTWSLVKENGPGARAAMYQDGIEAFVALLSEKDGVYRYSIGRKSQWIPFPLKQIFTMLNIGDGCKTPDNQWGPLEDGATIGGSPRQTGSHFDPARLTEIIEDIVKKETL